MLKLAKTTTIVAGCIVSLTLPGSARAELFEFDPGMSGCPNNQACVSNPFGPIDTGFNDGHPYDWYYQSINLDFSSMHDGREDPGTYANDPSGNIPYIILDGTDYSTAGHCIQVNFGPPNALSFPNGINDPVQTVRFSYINSSGQDSRIIADSPTNSANYMTARIWIKNTSTTGGSLYWHTKISDIDGQYGSWNQSMTMNIWRLDLNQADCTVNAYNLAQNPPPGEYSGNLWYVTMIGVTGNYQVCDFLGFCQQGG